MHTSGFRDGGLGDSASICTCAEVLEILDILNWPEVMCSERELAPSSPCPSQDIDLSQFQIPNLQGEKVLDMNIRGNHHVVRSQLHSLTQRVVTAVGIHVVAT